MDQYFESAGQVWARLDGLKRGLMTRVERYASLTIPKICLPDGFDIESMDQTHDYQSLGAQAVNHLSNKLMIGMFAPSRPFFRIAAGKKTAQSAAQAQLSETDLDEVFAKMERKAVRELDKLGQRPKLYQVMRHLVITGNCLLILDKSKLRIMGLRYYCVKRTHDGNVHTLVIREQMRYDELDPKIQRLWTNRYQPDSKVSLYRLIKRTPEGGYTMCQYVDDTKLPKDWDARWSAKNFPYRVLAWDLSDEANYGTGLVEEYAGDFEALSVLSESVVTGAVVGTEFRWTVAPNGMTSVDDIANSKNGDTIPGSAKDVGAISPPVQEAVKTAEAIATKYEQRIARGFLMTSAVTRNAERVTAEEVRLTSQELESGYGGTYAALAPSVQEPVAMWMLANADLAINGTDLEVVVVTGLDALSRNGDLDNLKLALGDLSAIAQAPPQLQGRIKWQDLGKFVGQGRGIELARFIMSEEEYAQLQQAEMARQSQADVQTAQGTAQAEADAQPPQ